MKNYRAIHPGYITIGEMAKKMGVTVRTLQYYDKEGLLPPSSESEGGRRLYTHKDLVRLHQILSMKYLGFSLKEIKTRLPSINTPEEVSNALSEQTKIIQEKINTLTSVLESIKKLNTEVLQMKTVNWTRYADILIALQAKNDTYWVIKHFDTKLLEHIERFMTDKQSRDIIYAQNDIYDKVDMFIKKGVSPENKQVQTVIKDFWDMIMAFTKGDMSLLPELVKAADVAIDMQEDKYKTRFDYIGRALDKYFTSLGYNPLEEAAPSASH